MTSEETGLRLKWYQTGVQNAYDIFGEKTFTFDKKTVEECMVLDQLKIAFGPYLTGVILAFVVLLIENSNNIDICKDEVLTDMIPINIDFKLPSYIPPKRSMI